MEPANRNIKDSFDKYITLEKELKELEKQIFKLETYYLDETSFSGNILKGWDQYLIKKGNNQQPQFHHFRKPRVFPNEMVFSLSSTSSPAVLIFLHQNIEEIFERNKDNCYGVNGYQNTTNINKRKRNHEVQHSSKKNGRQNQDDSPRMIVNQNEDDYDYDDQQNGDEDIFNDSSSFLKKTKRIKKKKQFFE